MKTKLLRIGKRSMSVFLSVLMMLSTVIVGSSVTVETDVDDKTSMVVENSVADDSDIYDDFSSVDQEINGLTSKKSQKKIVPEASKSKSFSIYFSKNGLNWDERSVYIYMYYTKNNQKIEPAGDWNSQAKMTSVAPSIYYYTGTLDDDVTSCSVIVSCNKSKDQRKEFTFTYANNNGQCYVGNNNSYVNINTVLKCYVVGQFKSNGNDTTASWDGETTKFEFENDNTNGNLYYYQTDKTLKDLSSCWFRIKKYANGYWGNEYSGSSTDNTKFTTSSTSFTLVQTDKKAINFDTASDSSAKLVKLKLDISSPENPVLSYELVSSGESYSVKSNISENGGTVTNLNSSYVGDEEVTFTAVPNSGYAAIVTVTDESGTILPVTKGSNNQYTFEMPNSVANVNVVFVDTSETYTVTTGVQPRTDGTNASGTVTPASQTVTGGSSVAITATADSESAFSAWTFLKSDGNAATENTDYILGSSVNNVNITVYPLADIKVLARFHANTGSVVDNLYFLYGNTDQPSGFSANGKRIYKRASTADYAIDGYEYYYDFDTDGRTQFYFFLSSSTSYTNSYHQKDDKSTNNWQITTSDPNLITNLQGNRDRDDYRFGFFSADKKVSRIRVYISKRSDSTGSLPDGYVFHIVPLTVTGSDETSETVTVYAKNGTIRDRYVYHGSTQNNGYYNKYSKLATTSITYNGVTASQNTYNNRVAYMNGISKNDTIKITTKINSDYKDTYYVKGFCINGLTYGVLDKEPEYGSTQRSTGEYTLEYKIPRDSDSILEITPIYFYLTDEHSTTPEGQEYITFYAEGFSDDVRTNWGNTISCYAWYSDEKKDDYLEDDLAPASKQPALGGYPGQPMVWDGGNYYMQIPKYLYYDDNNDGIDEAHAVQGVTMNNYYWDDVHLTKGDIGTQSYNCQTYDYDDFVALMNYYKSSETNKVEQIFFTFKYEEGLATIGNDQSGNQPNTENTAANTDYRSYLFDSQGYALANKWTPLVDVNNYAIDLLGYQLPYDDKGETKYYTESDINTKKDANVKAYSPDNTDPTNEMMYIVSNGYEIGENDYIGYYATKWYVYDKYGKYIAALPPSAFEWDVPNAYANQDLPLTPLPGFLGYSDKACNSSQRASLWKEYLKIANAKDSHGNYLYRQVPAVITYESSIRARGKKSDEGYRTDGRWYFSKKGAKIHSDIIIRIATKNSDGKYTYDDDTIPAGSHTGDTTKANAYFTNQNFYEQIDSGNVDINTGDYFTFVADGSSQNGSDTYNFLGWYLDNGSNDMSAVNNNENLYSVEGSKVMNLSYTFVALYEKVEQSTTDKKLVISHKLYSSVYDDTLENAPTLHNGTGKTAVDYVIVEYSDGSKRVINGKNAEMLVVDSEYLTSTATKVTVALKTTPDDDNNIYDVYNKTGSGDSTVYSKSKLNQENTYSTEYNITADLGSSLTEGSVVYTYDIADLFPTGTTSNTLEFVSDITSASVPILLQFKYYDRSLQNNQPATIMSEPKVLNYNLTVTNYTGLRDKIKGIVSDSSMISNEGVYAGDIDNLIDEYRIWSSMQEATDESAGFGNVDYYKLGTNEDGALKKYKDAPEYNDVVAKNHTTWYSALNTDAENWITYYTVNDQGEEVPITDYKGSTTQENGENVYSDNVDVTKVSRVVVWALNTPKDYHLLVFTDEAKNDNGEFTGATKLMETPVMEGLYAFKTTNGTDYPGLYNQRVGVADSETQGASNTSVEYLQKYYNTNANDTSIAFTGAVVDAPDYAYRANDAENKKYVFDGWYSQNSDGSYYKVSSDRVYGNRITTDLALYAFYRLSDTEVDYIPSVSVTKNGVDIYVGEIADNEGIYDQKKYVRLNTQLNIAYDDYSANNDNDTKIKRVAVIYVALKAQDFDSDGIKQDTIDAIREWIDKNKGHFEPGQGDSGIRAAGKVTFGDNQERDIVIIDRFNARHLTDSSATSSPYVTLTSKNRVQFVLPLDYQYYVKDGEELGAYQNIIAFGAIQYDSNGDGTVGATDWIISENYADFTHD